MTNLPLVWIFSSRNDVLLWVTGWTFATFNRFHRWVARVAVAQVVAHGVAYTFQLIYREWLRQALTRSVFADVYFRERISQVHINLEGIMVLHRCDCKS